MLEKIGLPPKPAQRGNNWVVDASHCQGCSSQFTFINRKHHCRRCGGLFCGSCTQQRMVLRGQGDSPVRICEPCKKLEEAARFELRHGIKSRSGRGGTKLTSRHEDEVLKQVLGNDSAEILGQASANGMVSSVQRSTSSASSSNIQEVAKQDEGKEVLRSLSVEEPGHLLTEIGSSSPEELRKQALDEKKKYKTLKAEGKSEEALRAFKRGKELERQAGSLELLLRKNRKKAVSLSSMPEIQKFEDNPKDTGNTNKLSHKNVNETDDFSGELRQLGWSDMELHVGDKKPASMSLEGELSKLLGEAFQRPKIEKETHGVDQTQIIAHKKKALALKREGKLGEAKEELKRAKVLEKQLEEQIFLAEAEDSDDELSSLMRSLDVDKQEEFPVRYEADTGFDFDHLLGIADDPGVNSNFEVTDEDMDDPEMVDALKSLGWTEESNLPVEIKPHFVPVDRDALLSEIQSLKAEALSKKRAGNTVEAIALLKKAKVLEKELENCSTQGSGLMEHNLTMVQNVSISQSSENSSNVMGRKDMGSKLAPKSRVMIQKELLGLKKRALALRREGRLEEADEELKKGKVLEQQLEEIDSSSKVKVMQVNVSNKHADNLETLDLGDIEEDVTDEDMHDPTLISLLGNLGWKDEEDENVRFPSKPTKQTDSISVLVGDSSVMPASNATKVGVSRRSKGEIQRELLGLKRKALSLRRKGEADEADEVLKMAKVLEAQLAEIEMPSQEVHVEIGKHMGNKIINSPVESALDEEDVAEEDMHNPELLLVLKNLGWKDEIGTVTEQAKPSQQISGSSAHSDGLSMIQSSLVPPRSKQEIQKEVLGLKRKALSLRRQGKTEEAEEVLKMAKLLEVKMEELEAPKEEVLAHALNVRENEGTAQAAGYLIDTVAGRATGLGRKQSDSSEPRPTRNTDISIPETTQLIEDKHPLSKLGLPGELKNTEVTGSIPPSGHSANVIDLLTGDDWTNSQSSPKNFDAKYIRDDSSAKLGFKKSPVEDIEGEGSVAHEKRNERVPLNNKPQVDEPSFVQVTVSQNDQSSLRKEILAHKRQAVALKREGKLVEAREELRQAKLLEKSLEDNSNPQPPISSSSVSSSSSRVTSIEQKESISSNLAPRPLSSRDRFKLQQESLSHKRLALKLRREGRTEEADAEFELAKALEAQLEESGAQNSSKSSVNVSESIDDTGIEDFLDPQLLSALKAIGLEDANSASRGPERLEPEKPNQERIQLEDQIKAEKVKAVNLKRSGKQAEALDALRRAKFLEKKLSSLAS